MSLAIITKFVIIFPFFTGRRGAHVIDTCPAEPASLLSVSTINLGESNPAVLTTKRSTPL